MIAGRDIAQVRGFNRLVTLQIGALQDRYLGRRPLAECRLLFEIGREGATPRELRARLGLDSGYLSRLAGALERDGLVESAEDPADRRTKRLRLTPQGEREVAELDRISDELAAGALEPLSEDQRRRLLDAQQEVRRLLAVSMIEIGREDPASPDARWCLTRYFAELAERFEEDFDPGRTLPADAKDLVPPRGSFVIARLNGEPAGCGALKGDEIMRMWVTARTAASDSAPGFSRRSRPKPRSWGATRCGSTPTAHSPRRGRCTRRTGTPRYLGTTTTRTPITGFRSP